MAVQQETLDIKDSLLASLLSDENFCPDPAGDDRRDGPRRGIHRAVDLQVPGRVRHEQGPLHRRPPLPAVQHHRAAAGHAADQPDRGPRRFGPLQRLLLQPDHAGPHAGDVVPGGLRLRRAGARAADGLRDLRRGPVDHRRGPGPGKAGGGRARHLRRSEPLREPGPGDQFGRGHVPVRRAGQRQIDARQADHAVLRPGDLDSARAVRRRPDHQVLRLGLPQAGDQRRAEHHQVRRSRPPLAEGLAAHGGRRRRADDGQPGTAARPAEQRQRGPLADEEQLRLPADRRLRPAADRARATAQSLDRAAGNAARLPHACRRARSCRCPSTSW